VLFEEAVEDHKSLMEIVPGLCGLGAEHYIDGMHHVVLCLSHS